MNKANITIPKIPIDISINYNSLLTSNVKLKFNIKKEIKESEQVFFIPRNTSGKS